MAFFVVVLSSFFVEMGHGFQMGGEKRKKKIACRDHCEICERVQGDFLRWMKNWVWILHASSGERKEKK